MKYDLDNFPLWTYPAEVVSVYDADSMVIKYDRGFGDFSTKYHRIISDDFYFDTPEIRRYKSVNKAHKQHGLEAKEVAIKLLVGTKDIYITTHKKGSFRYLAQIWLPQKDGTFKDYASVMQELGFQKRSKY